MNNTTDSNPTSLVPFLIGASYTAMSTCGLVLNIVVLVAIYRCGLLRRSSSTVFLLAVNAIADGTIRLFGYAYYLGLGIMLGRNLGDPGPFGTVSFWFTQMLYASWDMGSITELLIAVNRLISIKRVLIDNQVNSIHQEEAPFTRRNCLIYVCTIYPAIFTCHVTFMLLAPCCKAYFVVEYFAVIYNTASGYNYFFNWFIRPICFIVTLASVVCYLTIFAIITRAHAKNQSVNFDAETMARRRREQFSCLQFALAYSFYFTLWMTFEVMPYLPLHESVYWLLPSVYAAIICCSTTALIQATINSTVRREIIRMYRTMVGNNQVTKINFTKPATGQQQLQSKSSFKPRGPAP